MIESRAENRGRSAIILSGAKHDNRVRLMQFLFTRIVNDGWNNRGQCAHQTNQGTDRNPEQPKPKVAAGRRDHPFSKNSDISSDEFAHSRRIYLRASYSRKLYIM